MKICLSLGSLSGDGSDGKIDRDLDIGNFVQHIRLLQQHRQPSGLFILANKPYMVLRHFREIVMNSDSIIDADVKRPDDSCGILFDPCSSDHLCIFGLSLHKPES